MKVSFGNYFVAKDKEYNANKRQWAVERKIEDCFKNHYSEWGKRINTSLGEYLHDKNLDVVTTFKKDGNISIHLARGQNFPVFVSAMVGINPTRKPLKNINKKPVIVNLDLNSKPSRIEQQIRKFAEDCFSFVGERSLLYSRRKSKELRSIELDEWVDRQLL